MPSYLPKLSGDSQSYSNEFLTFVEVLRYRARYQPDQTAYTFLLDGDSKEDNLTYSQLDRKARAIAASLQSVGKVCDRVLVLYPSGLEYIAAFFGCLYAGMIAVPAYSPTQNQSSQRLQSIIVDVKAKLVLTTRDVLSQMQEQIPLHPELQAMLWIASDEISLDLSAHWQEPSIDNDTLAFLQYTSGSTSDPKGVMISHGNLLHNEEMIKEAFGHTERTIVVGWLPMYHDMGLIGNVLQPLYIGAQCILMSPSSFIRKPIRWLKAISHYKATTSGSPNFGYDLCIRKINPEQGETLDLSTWDLAFTGAEPVRFETMRKFAAKFEPCGFKSSAFYPCYGMAETTLLVTGGIKSDLPVLCNIQKNALEQNRVLVDTDGENSLVIVGCGQSWLDQKVLIVDPDDLIQCLPDRVGEIWVSGPNVAKGYWNRALETEQTFLGYLADTGEGPFLRTGDLGFWQDGELFVTGRIKDVIIIRGHNYYPQDIELTVETCHPALRRGCCAAFAMDVKNEEKLVVVQEVERLHMKKLNVDEVLENISQAVATQHGLSVYDILLSKPGSIPKTTSGKIQRLECLNRYKQRTIDRI